jgi:hypothetical protein
MFDRAIALSVPVDGVSFALPKRIVALYCLDIGFHASTQATIQEIGRRRAIASRCFAMKNFLRLSRNNENISERLNFFLFIEFSNSSTSFHKNP